MIIFATEQSNRLLYTIQFVCEEFGKTDYQITSSEEKFIQYAGPKINYSNKPLCDDEFYIQPSGFLSETGHRFFTPAVEKSTDKIALFPSKKNFKTAYPFDIFSAVFYMLSRYEEYNNKAKDKWKRFPATASFAYKNSFLHLPVVDSWLHHFFNHLASHFSPLISHPSPFIIHKKTTVSFTYDVDVAYAYKGRELTRQAGSAMKDILRINLYNLAQRTAVLAGYLEDPFDTYAYIKNETINPRFFFLLSERKTKYDRNINPKKDVLNHLINDVKKWSPVGIHPSFYSSEKEKKLMAEKKILEDITNDVIYKSRQHYLKFSVPQTYRALIKNGINEDYSMLFAETPGFRAGTCTPFYFFDVEKDEATLLKLYPACIMESTFRDDIIMPAEDALPYFKQYFDEVNKVNGHFICIWHNDTLAANNKQHFRWLHQQILQYIRSRLEV